MNNTKKFLSDVDAIQLAIETRKLVVFVGSGVSMNSGLPSWGTLVNELKSDIGIDDSDTKDPLQVAQIYYNERKQKEYIEKIRTILLHRKVKYNEINDAIFDLKPEHILTTNYDDLLEQVIKNRALPFSVVKKDSDFPYAVNSNLLVKIHGDLDDDNFVLKEEDYLEYESNHPLFEAFVKSIFSTKLVLFVGYSYSDVNLKIILQKVRNILGKNYQNSYLITHESFSNYKVGYLRDKGVNVLSYEDNEKYIEEYLNGQNSKNIKYNRNKSSLNKAGANLLDLITFISVFDRFKEDLLNYSPIEQMSRSLQRFSEMNTLPYFFIADLFPFNNTPNNIYFNNFDIYSLNLGNKDLFGFIQDNVDHNGNNNVLSIDYINTINNEADSNRIESHLKYVVDFLNYSAINIITLDYSLREDSNNNFKIYIHNKNGNECDCLTCLLNKLKLNELISQIQIFDITEASDIKSDALLAYSHYQCGNIHQAYNLFEETAQKAWDTGKYVLYFIAKFSLKELGLIVKTMETKNLSAEQIYEIRDKSKKIDLDSVYRQINDVSKEETALIKIIKDNAVLRRVDVAVSKEYTNIEETFNNLRKGTYYNTINLTPIVEFHLLTVEMFYNRNCIIHNEFYLREFFNKGIEALLLSNIMYMKYSTQDNWLNYNFCSYFIKYGHYNKLENFVKKHNIIKVRVSDIALDKLYDSIMNYLKSFINEARFGDEDGENFKLHYQVSKTLFGHKFLEYFDNIFLLLRIVEFDQDRVNNIGKTVLRVLNSTSVFSPKNVSNISNYFEGNRDLIGMDVLEGFLQLICNKPNYLSSDIIGSVAKVVSKSSESSKVSNELLVIDLLNVVDKKISYTALKSNYLYEITILSSGSVQDIALQRLIDLLRSDFSDEIYWTLVMNGLIQYDTFFDEYVQTVVWEDEGHASFPEGFYNLRGERDTSKSEMNINVINLIRLMYKFGLGVDNIRVDLFNKLSMYARFYIDPEGFEYEFFELKWLLYTNDSLVHSKLSKIQDVRVRFTEYLKESKDAKFAELYVRFYM